MAEPQTKLDLQTKPRIRSRSRSRSRSGCFLVGCFGFSRKEKPFDQDEEIIPYSPMPMSSSRNKSRLLSLPLFRLSARKSSRAKTVPVVDTAEKKAAAAADIDGQYKSHKSKLIIKKKSDTKLLSSDSEPKTPPAPGIITKQKPNSRQNSKVDQQPALLRPPSNRAATETPYKQRPEPNIILGNGKLLDRTRTGSSLPGSPTANAKPKPKTHTAKLSHTVSLPVLDRYKRVGYNSRVRFEDHDNDDDEAGAVQKYDPLIGMSIILMTLIIMLFWGRLCAILCTSAWFYFCPRFRTATHRNDGSAVKTAANSNGLDLNSEYKKKVVLEGLLERNHRLT